MNHIKQILVLSLSLLITDAALGQTSKKVSLEEAIKLGTENSKTLKISESKTENVKAKADQLKNQMIPSVSLNSNYTRISDNITPYTIAMPGGADKVLNPQILNQYTNRATVQYVLFAGFRTKNSLESISFLEKAATLDYEKDKLEIKNNIINAYYNYYKAIKSKDLVVDNIKQAEARVYDAKNLAKQGLILDNDVLKVEMLKSNLEMTKADVESAINISNYNLDILLGLPTETIIEIDETTLFNNKVAAELQSYIQEAANSRADLKAMEVRKAANYSTVKSTKGTYYPVLSVGSNYYYNNPNQRVFPLENKFKNTWDAGATLSWNLSQLYTTKAYVSEAKANLKQAEAATEQLSDAVKMEVNANYNGYLVALQKITLSEKSIEQATENQRVTSNKYKANTALMTDVLEADVALLQSKLNLINAKADADVAYFKLLKSTGK